MVEKINIKQELEKQQRELTQKWTKRKDEVASLELQRNQLSNQLVQLAGPEREDVLSQIHDLKQQFQIIQTYKHN